MLIGFKKWDQLYELIRSDLWGSEVKKKHSAKEYLK